MAQTESLKQTKKNLTINRIALSILYRLGLQTNRIRLFRTTLFGRGWIVPLINGIGHSHANGTETEPWIYSVIKDIHQRKPIDIFLDIGVNTGQTLVKIKSISTSIVYYGFEPNPACIFYVDYLCRLNKIKEAHLICVGLGEQAGLLDLRYEGIEDTRATFLKGDHAFKKRFQTRKVPVIPLDNAELDFKEGSSIVMKIDVEGFEFEVLAGASQFMRKYHPVIMLEVLPHHNDPSMLSKQERIFSLFSQQQYSIYRLSIGAPPEQINRSFFNEADYSKTDYVAYPSSYK